MPSHNKQDCEASNKHEPMSQSQALQTVTIGRNESRAPRDTLSFNQPFF